MLQTLETALTPFLWGGALALVLNVPMKLLEKRLGKLPKKLRRILSLSLVLAGLLAAVVLGGWLLAPQLGVAINDLVQTLPTLPQKISETLQLDPAQNEQLTQWLARVNGTGSQGLSMLWQTSLEAARSAAGALGQGFAALILAIYLLCGKESFAHKVKQVCHAVFGEQRADRMVRFSARAAGVFSGFVAGQCIEACILAGLFFLTLLLFRMPYALPISAVIGVTALVPVFGAWVGCGVGALLILPVSFEKAGFFLILFFVVQQFENNAIYPRVVGGRIGLPPIWVLTAVLLGGSLFGVAGLVLGIPAMSVLYHVGGEWVRAKNAAKASPHTGQRT